MTGRPTVLPRGCLFNERPVPAFVANIFLVTIESGYLAEILGIDHPLRLLPGQDVMQLLL
jgi:hypothetical protein